MTHNPLNPSFIKVRTKKTSSVGAKTFILQVLSKSKEGIRGRKANPATLAIEFHEENGKLVDTQLFIAAEAIAWHQQLIEDRKYGGLVSSGPTMPVSMATKLMINLYINSHGRN